MTDWTRYRERYRGYTIVAKQERRKDWIANKPGQRWKALLP